MMHHEELGHLIARYAIEDGIHATAVPRLSAVRISKPTDPVHSVHKAAICIAAQGRKQVILGQEVFEYGPGRHMLVSVDLPVIGQVIGATETEPYLAVRLDLDLDLCADLLMRVSPPSGETGRGLVISDTPRELVEAAIRLMRLQETPEDIDELAPLIEREMMYRLLKGEQGAFIRRMLEPENRNRNIGRAISWIKENYNRSFKVEDVASLSGMSPSSLHQHFREATAMSPLQYQKQLRLQEARRLIFSHSFDAASAGHSVGYDSPSQFSREYKRLFGAPPQRDIDRLRSEPQRYAEA
ncbi:AraC family transcriptional regulator [Rhizobium sp. KVB221]|uniref:AraC family transcriptional regulator n=1 Tax=Rhizobium setariae TaxID=2801340 RepID=A0A936YKJ4_9HYPH|nr:AraC family transcriptional regulator [Rhizobium setariae]MBL0372074.1 AraC family transcriptional regulator [Rhizobium setariae]